MEYTTAYCEGSIEAESVQAQIIAVCFNTNQIGETLPAPPGTACTMSQIGISLASQRLLGRLHVSSARVRRLHRFECGSLDPVRDMLSFC